LERLDVGGATREDTGSRSEENPSSAASTDEKLDAAAAEVEDDLGADGGLVEGGKSRFANVSRDVCFSNRPFELLGAALSPKPTARLDFCTRLTVSAETLSETSERIDRGTSSAPSTKRLYPGEHRVGDAGGEEGKAGDDAGAGAGLDEMTIVSGPPG
jgi:hypothetical protein